MYLFLQVVLPQYLMLHNFLAPRQAKHLLLLQI